MAWIGDWVAEKAAGLLKTGIQAGGNLTGHVVGSTGALIETTGRGLGNSANGAIGGVGGAIHGYGDRITESMAPSSALSKGSNKTAAKPSAASKAPAFKGVAKPARRVNSPVTRAVPSTVVPSPPKPTVPAARKSVAHTTHPPTGPPKGTQHERSSPGHTAKYSSRIGAAATSPHKAPGTVKARDPSASSLPHVGQAPLRGQHSQKVTSGKVRIAPASRARSLCA